MTDRDATLIENCLRDLQTVLRVVASVKTLDRIWAFRYTDCRNMLLHSALRPVLPGFLHQCISVDNFHSFIRFYDSDPGRRHSYIEKAFERCRDYSMEKELTDEASVPLGNLRVELMAPRRRMAGNVQQNMVRNAASS